MKYIKINVSEISGSDDPNWRTNVIPHHILKPLDSYKKLKLGIISSSDLYSKNPKIKEIEDFTKSNYNCYVLFKGNVIYSSLTLDLMIRSGFVEKEKFDNFLKPKVEDISESSLDLEEEFDDILLEENLDEYEKFNSTNALILNIRYAYSFAKGAMDELLNRFLKYIKKLVKKEKIIVIGIKSEIATSGGMGFMNKLLNGLSKIVDVQSANTDEILEIDGYYNLTDEY